MSLALWKDAAPRHSVILDGWSATLPLLDYGWFARDPPGALDAGTFFRPEEGEPALCVANIKALDQTSFDSKHVPDHPIR